MLTLSHNIFFVLSCIVLSITCLLLINHVWPPARRIIHNDVIGWQIGILGVIYAVLLGFMLFAGWENLQADDVNADNEANALLSVYRAAEGLPVPQRDEIQKLGRDYVSAVLTKEWPIMMFQNPEHRDRDTYSGNAIAVKMWAVLTQTATLKSTEEVSLRETMLELGNMTRYRRIRLLESRSEMPLILWFVLVIGGVITIGASCLIGSGNTGLHLALIVALSLMISLALMAIADINRPFQGFVYVSPIAFQRAQQGMSQPVFMPR